MAQTLTKRAQVLLTRREYARLEAIAKKQGKTISMLIREAVQKFYGWDGTGRKRRVEAVQRLATLALPVADWDIMEREIGFMSR